MKLSGILIIIVILLSAFSRIQAAPVAQSQASFFSLSELRGAELKELQPLEYINASDATQLAFRSYLPAQAKAILVFYHGAGAHSGLSYNHIGVGLRDDFNIAVLMPDLRGHGYSDGERGDAPSDEQVWQDINSIIAHARVQYPNLPVFVGGHSGGAGLTLNYATWEQRAAVDGYVFLSPYFGYRSETNHDSEDGYQFSSINLSDFIINSMSGGLFLGHAKAVKFNYPACVLESNPKIVAFNTVNMSKSVTPYAPDSQLSELNEFGLWIGDKDEAFDPVKVIQFAKENSSPTANKEIVAVQGENHFSIIIHAADLIGTWLTRMTK